MSPPRKPRLDRIPPTLATAILLFLFCTVGLTQAEDGFRSEAGKVLSCETAEACFRMAVARKEKAETPSGREQQLAVKVEQLRLVAERYPSSLWAKRAGVLTGVILSKSDPAGALRYLKMAQRDFPALDDYIRFWMGESLLKMGDITQAAAMFESIPQMAPDTSLMSRAAFRAGEAWFQASSCENAQEWLSRGLALNEKESPAAPLALAHLADCHIRENRLAEGRASLKQIWIRYPQSVEAGQAQAKLAAGLGNELWSPTADDWYARAQVFLGLALHTEAVDELRKFLSTAPHHPRRHEAKLKLGIALVRLKQYDQAKDVFRSVAADHVVESNEATVWLGRVYLRQGQGDRLLEITESFAKSSLSPEQKATIQIFAGIWLEDQARYEDAMAKYRQVVKGGEPAVQRVEALWRIGWVEYRMGHFREAIDTFQSVVDSRDPVFEPQALYWIGRAWEHENNQKSKDLYNHLCQRHVFTYYCQLARPRAHIPLPQPVVAEPVQEDVERFPPNRRAEIERESAYRRAVELKVLGLDQDAGRELAVLTEHYSRDQEVLLALSTLLNETGAHHHALRLARQFFRDKLERTGGAVAPALWSVAYPTALLPTIRSQGAKGVDPYLVAAIIREESQYDWRAVSRVGAIGLMQVMPATANAVAQRFGLAKVVREDLFDQETNIRIGVRYLEQLLEQFSGNIIFAVAAYNAGPPVVNVWISAHRDRDAEEFVELIPYQETRLYVKRVLRSYREYLRLDGAGTGAPLP